MNRLISMGELRLALRLILKQPILSATIIFALATGICFSTMAFTFWDELVNSALPYRAGERFARVFVLNKDGRRLDLDLDRYHALRDGATSFEHVGAVAGRQFTVQHALGEVESVTGTLLTPRSMRWLDTVPVAGRTLIPADGDSGAERVVVIRESLWRRRYSADPQLVGRQLTIGGQPRTVVGIMPDTFEFPNSGELWVPLDELTLGGAPGLRIFGVLQPGATFDEATAQVNQLSRQVATDPGEVERLLVVRFTGDSDDTTLVMSTMVFVVVMLLLVVASNVATLVFARTWSRAAELAVRTALGAARTRVVGQLFLEVLLLGAMAAVIGLAAASFSLQYIRNSLEGWPFWVTLQINPRIVAFVVLLTLLVGIVSGLWPALRVTRHDLRNALQAGRGFAAGGFGRAGAVLLVVEIALSVALLNGAVTLARAFGSYIDDVPALPANQVLTAHLGRVPTNDRREQIARAVAQLPGVQAAGAGQQLPRLYPPPRATALEPVDAEERHAAMPAPSHAVGPGFLEAIGARPLAGRLLAATDFIDGAAPVAVVNEPFVRKFLGGRNPVGRRIRVEAARRDGTEEPWREIVGVVPDLGMSVGDPALAGGFYYPVRDETLYYLAIRTTADPKTLVAPMRASVANLDPDLQLEEIRTLEEAGREERVFLSGVALALTAMGGMALLLSIVGIYALLSFMVTRRTREIGIRIALGAKQGQVLRSVTGGAAIYLAIGGVIGSVLGVLFAQMRSVMLISIPAPGVWMPATIFLTLAAAGLIACWLPARRALGIRPSEALSAE